MKIKRVFLVVLDSFGVGALPDAHLFSDEGSHTLRSVVCSPKCRIPNLVRMGLGNIVGAEPLPKEADPTASWGRMAERSMGKDTTVGHWELAGVTSPSPLPTYPNGFPEDVIASFEEKTGKKVLCNRPYSGTDVIRDYGEEHFKTGALIVYTSADSVFQIAAHEGAVPPQKLYEYCEIARAILTGEHGVGRVIARPFVGEKGNFVRTANRRDFSLAPPQKTLLDAVAESGKDVISVGKVYDIFAGRGITRSYKTASNREGMEVLSRLVKEDFSGLLFANLVEFDSHYGHRNDADGYAAALSEFDAFLPAFCEQLTEEDVLFITADHGCDPGTPSTDHSREYVPVLMFQKGKRGRDLGTRETFSDLAATVAQQLQIDFIPTFADPF